MFVFCAFCVFVVFCSLHVEVLVFVFLCCVVLCVCVRSLHVEVIVFLFGLKFSSKTILMLRFSRRLTKTLTIFKDVQEFVQHRC